MTSSPKVCHAIIQARMSSTRLPGKVLAEVNGRPLLAIMLERVSASKSLSGFSVATSVDPSDDPIFEFCSRNGIPVYRGNLHDVLDRYYQAALALPKRPDVVVRLTADCPLADPRVIDRVVDKFCEGNWDYVANTVPPETATYPDGMDVEVFSMEALERAWREASLQPEREHVTFYFWKTGKFRTHRVDTSPSLSQYRLTVDYPEDLELVKRLISTLSQNSPQFSMEDVIAYLEKNPALVELNARYYRNQGWTQSKSPTP